MENGKTTSWIIVVELKNPQAMQGMWEVDFGKARKDAVNNICSEVKVGKKSRFVKDGRGRCD